MKYPIKHYLVPIVFVLCLFFLYLYLSMWTKDAPTHTDSAFSGHHAQQLYQRLVPQDVPRPTGSQANLTALTNIQQFLTRQGFDTQRQQLLSCDQVTLQCANITNLIAKKSGLKSDDHVLLVSHHDTVPASPGSADPGAGMAILMAIAEQDLSADRGVMLLFTDAEEIGLLGAKAFIDKHPWADKISSVINLEARGTRGQSMLFETGKHNDEMVAAMRQSMPSPLASSFFTAVYGFMPNQTDFTLFRNKGFSGANFAFIDGSEHYHTPGDNNQNLDIASVQHQGDNALSLLLQLLHQQAPPQDSTATVFTDVFSQWLMSWPEGWTSLLLFFSALCISWYIYRLEQQQQFDFDIFIRDFLAWSAVLVVAVLIGWAMTFLVPDGDNRALMVLMSLLLALIAGSYFGHESYSPVALIVPWVIWFLFCLLVMLVSAGLSAPFYLPLLVFSLLLLPGLLYRPLMRLLPLVSILAGLFALLSMWRMGMQIEMAIGYRYPFVQLLLWVLGGTVSVAILHVYYSPWLRQVSIALTVVLLVFVLADRGPAANNSLNYVYLVEPDVGAHIVAVGDHQITHPDAAGHRIFQSKQAEYFPWSSGYKSHGIAVAAPKNALPAMKVKVTQGRYEVFVPGHVKGEAVMLIIKGRQPESLSINGTTPMAMPTREVNVLQLYNADASGTKFEFMLEDQQQSEVYVVRKYWGIEQIDVDLPKAGITSFSEGNMTMVIRQLHL
jgi:hypothetical protein